MSFDSFLRGAVAGPVTGGVLANDIDPDGDYMTATLVSPPAHGTLSMTADGGFVYTPSAGFVGADSFTYRASDGTRDSNAATVVLNVAPLGFAAGDLNDDGFVDEADLAIVVHDLGMAGGANRLQGDANGDGFVDLRDVLEVQRAMGANVPQEPRPARSWRMPETPPNRRPTMPYLRLLRREFRSLRAGATELQAPIQRQQHCSAPRTSIERLHIGSQAANKRAQGRCEQAVDGEVLVDSGQGTVELE